MTRTTSEPAADGTADPEIASERPRKLAALFILTIAIVDPAPVLSQGAPPLGAYPNDGNQIISVGVAEARRGTIPVTVSGLGTVTSLQSVTVKSMISGYLQTLPFVEGQIVKKGDVVAQIDARPYEALLAQYEGMLKKDQALLENARLDLERYKKLSVQDSISKQNVDTQRATVQQDEGTVAADQAQVDAQKLNVAYCQIVSPVTGRIGLRLTDAGNYVTASDTTGIVMVVQMQPISVLFALPEDDLPRISRRLISNEPLTVTAYDRADRKKIATGKLSTFDNQIDTTTGTIKLRSLFDNKDGALFPNQFVNAYLALDSESDVVTVPIAAIQHGTPGAYVYKLYGNAKVALTVVETGESSAGKIAVRKGLSDGDRVVVDGIDRLRDGATIKVVSDARASETTLVAGDGR